MTQVLTTLQSLAASVAANALVVAIIQASLLGGGAGAYPLHSRADGASLSS